ncbi:PIG-L family deacetylase [candidate division KSB1 bacterium]|nr:PIG-L family deacetylase [candidate division KSB1 bacterium]
MKKSLLINLVVLIFLFTICVYKSLAQLSEAPPNPEPDARYKSDILLIVAHPDDETAVGSYLAKAVFDLGKKVAIIYINRGSEGGNTTGNEQADAMAAMREIEVRRAVAEFGIFNVWILNGKDTPGQDVLRSLSVWKHGDILEQVVRLVRLTRPEVILTWLPHFSIGENHGDHQASSVIAIEAFDMAGNPTVFPAQVITPRERYDINNFTEGLRPWQPKKLYFFSDASHPFTAEGPEFDISEISPSQNVAYYKLAARLHMPHLTQGDVSDIALEAQKTGDYKNFIDWMSSFKLIFGKSVVKCNPGGDVFEGITESVHPFTPVSGYVAEQHKGVTMEFGGPFLFYRDFWKAHDIGHIGKIFEPEIGISYGGYLHIPLVLRNGTSDTVSVSLTGAFPEGWQESAGSAIYTLSPGKVYPVQTFAFAPDEGVDEDQFIVWTAKMKNNVIGSLRMKVSLSEWTLPQ